MRKLFLAIISLCALACTRDPEPFPDTEDGDIMQGGVNTVFDASRGAFGHSFPNLPTHLDFIHGVGDHAFGATFVTAPAVLNPGLGPLYNNVSCVSCHVNDGRGKAEFVNGKLVSALVRISVPGQSQNGGPKPAPNFGLQVQDKSVHGYLPEGTVSITYTDKVIAFVDGLQATLRQPAVTLVNTYKDLPAGVMLSLRVAPPMHGIGLLEAISTENIMAKADPNDADGDGISGRVQWVWDLQAKVKRIGRFGWKAENPTIKQQVATAYNEDMGITSPLLPLKSITGQFEYPQSLTTDINDSILDAATFYSRTLAVPARRNFKNTDVIQGKALFTQIGCAKCHTPRQETEVNVSFKNTSGQTIYPYTDMLLHDMGEGLSDNRPSYEAAGSEWRTPALWGIGLTKVVNSHNNYLHDGRARSLEEAILWHGGEAEKAQGNYRSLTGAQRKALLSFLEGL